MQEYQTYQLKDFLDDLDFIDWVVNQNQARDEHWDQVRLLYPDKEAIMMRAKNFLLLYHKEVAKAKVDKGEIAQRFEQLETLITQREGKIVRRQFGRKLAAVAATIAILLMSWFVVDKYQHRQLFYQTDFGETKTIHLSDGSTITLSPNSNIRFSAHWRPSESRTIKLNGEAFFEVAKQPGRKDGRFIVYAKNLIVEALGTSFNVKSRSDNPNVVLNSGKVRVSSPILADSLALLLTKGEKATLEVGQKLLTKDTANLEKETGWRNNILDLEGSSLAECAKILESYFGYEVQIMGDSLTQETFQGSYPLDDEEILIGTLRAYYRIEIRGKQMIINSKE